MKKKNYIMICLIIIGILLVTVLIGIFEIHSKEYTDKIGITRDAEGGCSTDEGMYYFQNSKLMFLDRNTGKTAVVCNRADCRHIDDSCNAYEPSGFPPVITCYGDYVFVGSFGSIYDVDDNGNDVEKEYSELRIVKKDGSSKRVIYHQDSGAVLGMEVINGVLYFTAWTYQGTPVANVQMNDVVFYSYDLRWKQLKKIKKYVAGEDNYNAGLYIVPSDDIDNIYMLYNSTTAKKNPKNDINEPYIESDNCVYKLIKYNISDKKILEIREDICNVNSDDIWDVKYLVTNKQKYVAYTGGKTDSSWTRLVMCDDQFQDQKIVCEAEDVTLRYYDGYINIVNSDYNKILFDYYSNEFWIANTAITLEGKYISSLVSVDYVQNTVYIDAQDYTGLKPGDVIPNGMDSIYVPVSITEFKQQNYIEMKDYKAYENKLQWIHFAQ